MNFWYTKSSSDEEGDGEDLTSCREGFGEIFRSQLSWGMRRSFEGKKDEMLWDRKSREKFEGKLESGRKFVEN
jgi:hypothetical protein